MGRPNPDVKTLDDLPLILTPEDIMRVFGISKNTAHELWFDPSFPGYRVGRQKFVNRDPLAVFMKMKTAAETDSDAVSIVSA